MYGKRKSLFIRNRYQIVMTILAVSNGFGLIEFLGMYLPPKFRISLFISGRYIPLKYPIGGFDRSCRIYVEFLVDRIVCRQISNSKEKGNALCFYFPICDLIFIVEVYQMYKKGYILLLHLFISIFYQIF